MNLRTFANLDRRWIFVFVAIAVIVPLAFPLKLPIEPSKPVRNLYAAIDALPPDALVCMSFDYGPSTRVECHPMAIATLRHVFQKGGKVVGIALWPEGAFYGREALNAVAAEKDKKYGVDYANLGYKSGGEVVLRGMGDDFRNLYSDDLEGTRMDNIPLMKRVKGWRSFDMVLTFSAGKPGIIEHIRVVGTQYNRVLGAGVTAVQAPEVYPFLNAGQLVGLMGGLRGAAEYEVLLGEKGTATPGMDAQSIVHFMIAGFILFSNILYFAERRDRLRRSQR